MSPSAPTPIGATLNSATGAFVCTFDQALQAGTSAGPNWRVWANFIGTPWYWTFAAPLTIAGATVSGTAAAANPAAGAPRCRYLATPADVLALTGLPAASFADFPVIVT